MGFTSRHDSPADNVKPEKEEDNQVNGNQQEDAQLQLVKEENQALRAALRQRTAMNDRLRRRIALGKLLQSNQDDGVSPKPRRSGAIDGSSHSSMTMPSNTSRDGPLLLTAQGLQVAPANNNSDDTEREGTATKKVRVSVRIKTEEDKV